MQHKTWKANSFRIQVNQFIISDERKSSNAYQWC